MYKINDTVEVITEGRYKGTKGVVVEVFPAGIIDIDTIYTIVYEKSRNRGMFKQEELELCS